MQRWKSWLPAANEESEKASREYEEACRQKKYAAAENHTLRSSFLEEALETLKTDHEALLKKIQDELDESLMALYAENVAGSGTGEGDQPRRRAVRRGLHAERAGTDTCASRTIISLTAI